ncbi:MAG TPA: type II toxin-antitoxin system HicB family antitoxin [Gammaproteobacteria bacterium]|jgi:predicted HicB family RNase H-like nuclease|nr:type II toxin-antitoxin system HicB family antitoxin [Xanthomonadales bacterium]MCB1603085.1 type II toxin-antitoxin system HicB family antitoxin [Xanthomonadales bacterium]HPI96043.1 type II toxin-antitoxin system HicB family antitoxin [Gammaproteobacteria bacterium]HPQ87553.1 type II toxin-antitoxin system HicB family antitoxin [Gammaproteobacteria bacterium]
MNNILEIGKYKAHISYDPEIDMFRGEFIGLNGGADFYAKDIDSLKKEAETSLKVFLDVCQEKGIQPEKTYSGKFNLRVDPELHHMIALAAKAEDVSINEWVKNRCVENLRQ